MSLVGDLIMDVRRRIPDAPPVAQPVLITAASQTVAGGSLPLGTYFLVATATNPWGETIPSAETSVTLTGTQNSILVTFTVFPIGYNFRVYLTGNVAGSEHIMYLGGPTPNTITILSTTQGQPGIPPTRSTAFIPDNDGNFLGAFSAFQNLNRALSEMVRIAGGIIDVTGVQSTINTSMYRLDAPFYQFVNAWFDGYPMDVVPRSFMYLRNSAPGFSGILSYEQDGTQSVIQVWPQSNRTGGQSTLTADIGETSTAITLASAASFLAIGLVRIDDEVMVYSNQSGNTLGGILRGMGGTEPATHLSGATVTELNVRLSGRRMAPVYAPGDSMLTLNVPQAWETPLVLHMLSQVRSMEQDDAAAEKLLSDFQSQADKIAKQSRLGGMKPRQIPVWGQNTSDARNVNGIGFGWLIN